MFFGTITTTLHLSLKLKKVYIEYISFFPEGKKMNPFVEVYPGASNKSGMPRWVDCKHCKGQGWLYPSTKEWCRTCNNESAKKAVCDRCRGKGWEMIVESVMCCDCNGDGRRQVEDTRQRR